MARYPVSSRIVGQISGIRSDIWQDMSYPVGYFAKYPVSGRIVGQISSIQTNRLTRSGYLSYSKPDQTIVSLICLFSITRVTYKIPKFYFSIFSL